MSAVRDRQNINTEVRKEYVKQGRASQMTGNSLILLFYADYCSHRSNSSMIGFFPHYQSKNGSSETESLR